MAIIQYSGLVNKIIGKVGGVVFQKMGQSLGVRGHMHHKPSNTTVNSLNRFNFARVASAWGVLTPSQKAAWVAAQASFTFYNRYGTVIQLNGYQFFQYIQKVGLLTGLAFNITPQTKVSGGLLRGPYTVSIVLDTGFFITFTYPISATLRTIVYVSDPQNSPIQLQHPKFYFLVSVNGTGYVTPNLMNDFFQVLHKPYVISQYVSITIKTWSVTYNQWVQEATQIVQLN